MNPDSFVSRGGADSESYMAHSIPRRIAQKIESRSDLDRLMPNAIYGEHPGQQPVDRTPVITDEIRADTQRRLAAPVLVTETVGPDGTVYREYKEDRTVKGDGLIDTATHVQRIDRGEGTRESISMLSKEGKVSVDGLLPRQARDISGRFAKAK